jgi:parallel beta-helix repeat protein
MTSHDENRFGKFYFNPAIRLLLLAALLLLTISLAGNAVAAGGIQSIGNCTIIDKPGSYVLANDITATARDLKTFGGSELACILIIADFVTLDLDGYTIVGPGSGFGIYVNAPLGSPGRAGVHVRNGAVTGFERGIALEGSGHTTEQVRVTRNGQGVTFDGNGLVAREVQAFENADHGILCFGGSGHSVRDSQAHGNSIGISLFECTGSSIIGNTLTRNGVGGILVKCPSLLVQNMASENGAFDISTDAGACTRSDNNPAP